MAQVSLQINGYGYILGCADGEEEHLRALAADLDRRIDEIKASTGPSGEARLLLMAALVLSDELHDLRGQAKPREPDTEQKTKTEPKAGRRLRGLAKRAEAIADSASGLALSSDGASDEAAGDASADASGETSAADTDAAKSKTGE
jgi:cell division protein ZapA